MTKSKRQLRAEAVERLRQLNCMDVDCYQLLEAVVDDAGEKVGYRVEIRMLIDLLTDDAHESRGSYEERLHDVPVSDCPYCGCKRVVIHDFNDIYEKPHSYRVEHMDEKEAFNAGCFESYYSFDSAEKAVEHANMRDPLTDEPMDAQRDSDGTCPIDDGTVSNHSKNAPTLSDLYGILGGENVPETPDFAENQQKTEFKERESTSSDELPEGDAVAIMRKVATCGECTGYTMRKEVGGIDWADALLILADMVERDYVSREVYEDLRDEFTWETTFLHRMGKKCGTKDVPSLVAYVDKLEARVEELEAVDRRIAETDSRWEAAIRDLERMTAERDELQRQLETAFAPSGKLDAQSRAEIEDMERSRAVSGDLRQDADVDSTEGGRAAQDTREKLEADVRQYANPEGNTGTLGACWERKMIEFLDRQAAITTQECTDVYETGCEACRSAQKRKIAELQEQLDTMRDVARKFRVERDELQERVDNLCASEEIGDKLIAQLLDSDIEKNRRIVEYAEKVAELEAELDTKHGALNGVTLRDLFGIWKDTSDELEPSSNQLEPDTRENLGSNLGSGSEVGSEVDSREKLEADVRRWFADEYYDDYYSEEDMNSVVSKWLDRQAAITQDETIHDYNIAARESGRILRDEIAELKADNDCLRDRNEKLDYEVRDWKGEAKTQRNNFYQATEARKHWQRKYESVKAERDELKSKADALEADKASWQSGYHIDRLAKLQAQRDRYRDLLSKAVDEAQVIVKLMEVDS